jgi:thioredoxin 1
MILYKFYAEWCGPCKMLSKVMDNLEFPHEIVEVDIDQDQETPRKYGVRGVPALILADDDGIVEYVQGIQNETQLANLFGATKK